MHTNITLLDIIFRLCIFGLLAYKICDLIQKFLIPFFGEQITLERNQRTELVEKEKLLISTRHRIENQIYSQKQMFTLLEKNIQVWHATHTKENQQAEEEMRSILEKIEEKRSKQRKNIILSNTIGLTLPHALEQARNELTVRYQENTDREVLKKIIDNLPFLENSNSKVM